MSWLGLGLGEAGSQLGQGFETAQNWQQRAQEMKMQQARQKLQEILQPLQLAELQQRIASFNQPKPEGLVNTPGGGTSGATFTPGGGYSLQPLQPGADKNAVKAQIKQIAASSPKEYQGAIAQYADSIDLGEDPITALQKAQTLAGQAAGKESTAAGKTKFKLDMKNGIVSDKEGKEWSIYDPQLPTELKNLVDSARKREGEEDEKKATVEARKNAEALSRALQIGDMREANKQFDAVQKVAQRGVAGHAFLKSVEDQTARAAAGGGQGTTSGDLLLIEGYMQLMFGVDPKALRGSPQMQQQLLKQGGVDDRVIAWFNGVQTGGKLDQNVRQEILDSSRDQVKSFDQAVEQTGQLVDNPKVQSLVQRYKRATGAGQQPNATSGTPPPPPGYVIDKKGP